MNRRKRKKQPEAAFRRLMRATTGPTSVRKMRRLMNGVVSARMKWLKEFWRLNPAAKEVAVARARLDAEALVVANITGSDLVDATAYYLQNMSHMRVRSDPSVPRDYAVLSYDIADEPSKAEAVAYVPE